MSDGERIERDLQEVMDDLSMTREELVKISQTIAGHEVRFGNGREVMAEMKKDIEALKPKAPDWLKVLGVIAGVGAATLGAHYWLIEQFADRPTAVQVEKAFHEHADLGHPSTQRDINVIRENQAEQRAVLTGLEKTVDTQGQKLDIIIERLPERRGRDR